MIRIWRRSRKRRVLGRISGVALALVLVSFLQVGVARVFRPPFTPLMAYRWLTGEGVNYQWRPLDRISPSLQQAVMASEDQRFVNHHGFDWREVRRAIQEMRAGDRRRGASTITMQVARNLYLWQGHSWLRKGLEAYYTILIELLWPKWRIMEVYLNVAEWGRGVFGAQAAARHYFRRTAVTLTRSQSALLAAVLPSPRKWSPVRPTSYIKGRRNAILRQMDRFRPLAR